MGLHGALQRVGMNGSRLRGAKCNTVSLAPRVLRCRFADENTDVTGLRSRAEGWRCHGSRACGLMCTANTQGFGQQYCRKGCVPEMSYAKLRLPRSSLY